MRLRTALGLGALLLAAAMPATSLGQRIYDRPSGRNYFGGGPFGPSTLFGNGYQNRYGRGRVTGPLRFGGATVYFGPGGGYGYQAPVFGYGYPYSEYYGYPLRLRYGSPSYGYPY